MVRADALDPRLYIGCVDGQTGGNFGTRLFEQSSLARYALSPIGVGLDIFRERGRTVHSGSLTHQFVPG